MSREIKFRGKIVDNREWVFGMYLISGKNHHSPNLHVIYSDEGNLNQYMGLQGYTVIPETVGQFTGLTDKNGKERFTGDVIKRSTGYVFIEKIKTFSLGSNTSAKCFGYDFHPSDEIIGNIHDNPELCKQ